jgi:hypothetical protein
MLDERAVIVVEGCAFLDARLPARALLRTLLRSLSPLGVRPLLALRSLAAMAAAGSWPREDGASRLILAPAIAARVAASTTAPRMRPACASRNCSSMRAPGAKKTVFRSGA